MPKSVHVAQPECSTSVESQLALCVHELLVHLRSDLLLRRNSISPGRGAMLLLSAKTHIRKSACARSSYDGALKVTAAAKERALAYLLPAAALRVGRARRVEAHDAPPGVGAVRRGVLLSSSVPSIG